MKSLLFHTYEAQLHEQRRRVLSVFIACHQLSDSEFDAELAAQASRMASPVDAVHIVGYGDDIEKVRSWLRRPDDVSRERLRSLLGRREQSIRFVAFDPSQGRHSAVDIDGVGIDDAALFAAERNQSLFEAFVLAGAEQRAPFGTHYVKTSESHSDRFLRVSNLLEVGANVQLVAFWLLPYLWKTQARHLIVDTSGIYSVALAATQELQRIGGLATSPRLWSHQSHEGVDRIQRHEAEAAIFLLSASTSGGLVRKLLRRGAEEGRVVTLFSLAADAPPGQVLCDLKGCGDKGLDVIQNHAEGSCPYCAQNFHVIRIQGDQFAIAPPEVTLVDVHAKDLPASYKAQLAALAGLRAFHAFRRRDGGRICTVGMDVAPILSAELVDKNRGVLAEKREEWKSMVRRGSIVSLKTVVACSYPHSIRIAEKVAEDAGLLMLPNAKPTVVASSDLSLVTPRSGASAIVVSACIDESKELLSVSRALRDVQPDGTISYLTVTNLIASAQDAEGLKTNITYGRYGAGTFSLHSLFSFHAQCFEEVPSWTQELAELQRVLDWADKNAVDAPEELTARIERLQRAPAEGLVDDLFWADAQGHALKLRSDFTLIVDALRPPAATQADLFAAVVIVLSNLRRSTDVKRRLAHNAYQRAVLSPQNFARYSDGVLQASFLRAADPKELAYGACDPSVSQRMLDILLDALPNARMPERSEALTEFLVALITRRLTLHTAHLASFTQALAIPGLQLCPVTATLARYLSVRQG